MKTTDAPPEALLLHPAPRGILAFTTKRAGGVSTGRYATLNVASHAGDSPANVQENRRRLANWLSIAPQRLIIPRQVHGTVVRRVDTDFFSLSVSQQAAALDGVDALVTNLPATCIGVSTADCVPILIYDPTNGALAAAHAGWRGTVSRIATTTVEALVRAYDCRPRNLRAIIGPGISLAAFEVGDEVYDTFRRAGFPMEHIARHQEKWHIDLWEANRLLLLDAGLAPTGIHVSGLCTYLHPDAFFSARRLGTQSGRAYSGILRREADAAP